jgi:hypothetical protein
VVKNFIILGTALLLMATSALAADKPKEKEKEKSGTIDSGSFGIFVNGKRIGTEKFDIEQHADEGVAKAEIDVADSDNNKSEQNSEMHVGSDGNLRSYRWHSTLPTREESVVEPKDEFLIEHMVTSEQKKRDVPYILPLQTVILDDNFFSQRELLIWRYLATGCMRQQDDQLHCGPAHFGILVPRQHAAANTVVELMGRDKITVKGVEKELNKIKINTDGSEWFIWVDDPENHYKVIKMSIPANAVEVLRD